MIYSIIKKIFILFIILIGFWFANKFYQEGNMLLSVILSLISIAYTLELLFKNKFNKIFKFIVDLIIITGYTALISYILIFHILQ